MSKRTASVPVREYRPWWIAAALAFVVIVIYWQTGGFQFVDFDDGLYVAANSHVQRGLSFDSLVWAFGAWKYIYWQPLTFVSHMLDVTVFGLDPGWHHLTNVLLHAANSALLFLLLLRMTGARWPSTAAAALFALHPLRVESVAWVAERKDVLSGLFCILTLWTYQAWTRRRAPYWSWLVCGAFGLMSKPMLVTLPFLLLLVDEWPLRRNEPIARRIVEKIPLFGMAFAVALATYFGQRAYGATRELEHVGLPSRLANALVSYAHYLAKTLWPDSLAVFYPYREHVPALTVGLCALLLAAISAVAVWMRVSRPYLFTGWFWFVGMLVPTIGLVQVGAQSMADRFSYLPSIGLTVAIVWLVADARWNPRWVWTGLSVILTILAVVTWRQIGYWRDGVTLFAHAVEVTSDNSLAQHNLGFALAARGDYQAAIPHLRESIRLHPAYFQAHYNLGRSLAALGHREEALAAFDRSISLKPDYAESHFARATMLQQLGRAAEAEDAWRTALALPLEPAFAAEGHNGLGVLLGQKGDYGGAAREFEKALALRPDLEPARRNLAMARRFVRN